MTFKATFWRGNPQLKNGGYEIRIEIEAKTIAQARKKAHEIEKECRYGTRELISITKAE